MSVQVYNEWDPIEELIVGSPLYARIPQADLGFKTIELECKETDPSVKPGNFPAWLIEETEEDISVFIKELEKLNIRVKRPTPIDFQGKFRTPDWESDAFFSDSPRDVKRKGKLEDYFN